MLGVKSLLLKQQLPINVDITGGMVIKGIIENPIYIVIHIHCYNKIFPVFQGNLKFERSQLFWLL